MTNLHMLALNCVGMRLVGAMDVPSETTDPNVLTWGWAPLSEKHGTWQWHMIDVMDLQFELNANNTVMRSCNFKDKKVMETGDISANMSFFLAREDEHGGSSVAPGFHPHRVDRTVEWHDEMQRLFDEKNVFRRSHEKPINVMFTARFTEVREVETMLERFGASVEVTMSWPLTRVDAADWVAATDRSKWVPASFRPPAFEVANTATSKGAEPVIVIPGRCKLRVRAHDNRVVVTRRIQFRGDFYEPFELQAYPFDVQPLKLVLRTPRERPVRESSCNFIYIEPDGKNIQRIVPRDTEWRHNKSSAGCRFIPEGTDDMEKAEHSNAENVHPSEENTLEKGSKSISRATIFGRRSTIFDRPGRKAGVAPKSSLESRARRFGSISHDPQGLFELTVEVVVERLYMVHVIRVVLVLALFSLTSIAALCEDDDVNALDRLALLVTLMLTSATYSLVVKGDIPALGYVTLVDTYVLCTFSFIAIVVMQVVILEWIYPDGNGISDDGSTYNNGNTNMNIIAVIDLGLWFALHISAFMYTFCRVLPNERQKTDVIGGGSSKLPAVVMAVKKEKSDRKKKKKAAKGCKVGPHTQEDLDNASDVEDMANADATDDDDDDDVSDVEAEDGADKIKWVASAGTLPFPELSGSDTASELFQSDRASPDADTLHGDSIFGKSRRTSASSVGTTGIWQTASRKLSNTSEMTTERPRTADLVVRAVTTMSVAAHVAARSKTAESAGKGAAASPKPSQKPSPKPSPSSSPTSKRKKKKKGEGGGSKPSSPNLPKKGGKDGGGGSDGTTRQTESEIVSLSDARAKAVPENKANGNPVEKMGSNGNSDVPIEVTTYSKDQEEDGGGLHGRGPIKPEEDGGGLHGRGPIKPNDVSLVPQSEFMHVCNTVCSPLTPRESSLTYLIRATAVCGDDASNLRHVTCSSSVGYLLNECLLFTCCATCYVFKCTSPSPFPSSSSSSASL